MVSENQVAEVKEENAIANAMSESASVKSAYDVTTKLRVYKKKSTFKGAKEDDYYYSATRSDGIGLIVKFKCAIPTESTAFEISNVIGTCKNTVNEKNGVTYNNCVYYVNSCDFDEIEGTDLPL